MLLEDLLCTMSHHHATLSVKKERDFVGTTGNSGCLHSFGLPPSQQQSLGCGSPVEKRSPFLLLPGDHHHHHQQQQQYSPSVNKEGFEIDMDLAKFLGDTDLHTPSKREREREIHVIILVHSN